MDLISSDSPLAFSTEAALRALAMVANLHHIPLEPETLAHQMGWALPGQARTSRSRMTVRQPIC